MADYAVAVCGFPRCGSTMTMRMLDAGGLPPVTGSSPGSYELPGLDGFAHCAPADLIGRGVKLLDYPQWYGIDSLPDVPWRFIWLDRNSKQQALSTVKFMRGVAGLPIPDSAAPRLRRSIERDRTGIVAALRSVGPVMTLRFEYVLREPLDAAAALAQFCGINAPAAAAVVHRRQPECLPDLAVERAVVLVGDRS